MTTECLFCKISKREIPSKIVYEDDEVLAFPDINPKAPVHILIVPKKHLVTLDQATMADQALLGSMLLAATKLAKQFNLSAGYKLAMNVGRCGGQVVNHLHLHLLGGGRLSGLV